MEAISLKLDETFLKVIEENMRKHCYSTKTEFIREAIRDKIKHLQQEEALLAAKRVFGSSRRKTTDMDLRKARKKAFARYKLK